MQHDDPTAHVQALFVQHLPALRGFVVSLVLDFSLVDDVIQETFVTVSAKAATFQRGSNFRAWTWSIARFKALRLLEKARRSHERLSTEVLESLCADEGAETALDEAALRHLAECLEKLPTRARQAVELRYQQAHRPPEIARRMGWTVEAVHVALSRARVALRNCVENRLAEEGA
ncbi:MAG: sigma-70 family RNA polymerase sigma factor [Limisphaerales bacterium]